MAKLFYDFCFANQNRGFYRLEQTEHTHISETKFHQENGELYVNRFSLKLKGQNVLAYRYHDNDWVDIHSRVNAYSSSAYSLLLPNVVQEPLSYTCIFEHDGSAKELVLRKEGSDILETHNGKLMRRFTLQNGSPVRIDWGGPVSHLCSSFEQAIEGSNLDL